MVDGIPEGLSTESRGVDAPQVTDRALLHLVITGVITWQEAKSITEWSQPGDSLEILLGYVAGEMDIAPREIADALVGSGVDVKPEEIEVMKRGYMAQIRELDQTGRSWTQGIANLAGIVDDTMSSVAGVFDDGAPAGWGLKGFDDPRDPVEVIVAKRDAEEDVLAFIDQLLDAGAITESKARKLRTITTGDRSDRIEEVYNELWRAGTPEEQKALQREFNAEGEAGVLDPYELAKDRDLAGMRSRMARRPTPVEIQADMAAPESQMIDSTDLITGQFEPGDPTNLEGNLSFYGDMQKDGIGIEPIDMPTPRARARYINADFIVDPSTGQAYSEEEWALIKSGDKIAVARYEASKIIAPAIVEILNRPHFSQQIQWDKRTVNYQDRDGTWQTREVDTYEMGGPGGSGDLGGPGPIQIPVEDFGGVRSPSPTNPWETESFDYREGDGYAQWMSMTNRERSANVKLMHSSGLITDEQYEEMGTHNSANLAGVSGYPVSGLTFDMNAMALYEQATSYSAQFQTTPGESIMILGEMKRDNQARTTRSYGGGGAAPKYSVPASLRTIPDYKSLAQESKGIFRQSMGRDLEDWELSILADQLKEDYSTRNDQMIVAHRAAWEDAVAGGSTEVDYSDVTDPTSALEFDIEERYAGELDRQERVQDRAMNRRILMDSISIGQRMIP